MRRREFLSALAGTVICPAAASAQKPAIPEVGFLYPVAGLASDRRIAAFRRGLAEVGYVEGQTVSIRMAGADGKLDRLPSLAAELIQRQVAVIVAPQSSTAVLAAARATKTIPIIFSVTADPVKLGLVASLGRPGGNATGVYALSTELAAKRLGLLRELLPNIRHVGVLFNPDTRANEAALREIETAAVMLGLRVSLVRARTEGEIDAAFAELARLRPDALLSINDPLFASRAVQLALLAARYGLPAMLTQHEYAEAGGLMSYGPNLAAVYHQLGTYTGRVLKGAKPVDLPVEQSSRFEFVINLQAAKTLGLEIPPTLLARADVVIE